LTYTELVAVLHRALHSEKPVVVVLAGSNGAGKTTFYELYLERLGLPFVNPDRIAQLLNSAQPELHAYQGAKFADEIRRDLISRRLSFFMESVFSDPVGEKVQFLKDAQGAGYTVIGVFIQLSDSALSAARVIQRVSRGGHDVPDDKIQSRFGCTARNIQAALQFVDVGLLINNSSAETPYLLVEIWEHGVLQPQLGENSDADE
jgi:predicted ABC-type ATPase